LNPLPTVDVIIEVESSQHGLRVVFIERRNEPHGWALPGGFVDYGETVEEAAIREAREETSLDVELRALLGVYSAPDRDPRHHTISIVFVGRAQGEPVAADDARRVVLADPRDPPRPLAFDHDKIVRDYVKWIGR
jgi:ADP-ribose pyrophosphatase YjhB (NUDIX family)